MGGDEFPSVGGFDRGDRNSGAGLRYSDPCRGAWFRAVRDDTDGHHQPYGVGDVSAFDRSWTVGAMADNRDPPSKAS